MALQVSIRTLVIVQFYVIEFLMILCQLINYIQKFYEYSILLYYLKTIQKENYFHHQNHQQHLTKVLKLLRYYFLMQILTYQVVNQTVFFVQCLILSHFILILYQNKIKLWNTFTILSQFLVKNLKWFLTLLK